MVENNYGFDCVEGIKFFSDRTSYYLTLFGWDPPLNSLNSHSDALSIFEGKLVLL